jgi:gluconokinase
MTIIILMGVSGAGKTTIGKLLAGTLGWSFYEGDEYHPETNIEKMKRGTPLTDEDREEWLAALEGLKKDLEKERRNAVITCSALRQIYRDRLLNSSEACLVYLKGSYDLILKRMEERRDHFMRPGLLKSQFETLEEPSGCFAVDVSQSPRAIVQEIIRALGL